MGGNGGKKRGQRKRRESFSRWGGGDLAQGTLVPRAAAGHVQQPESVVGGINNLGGIGSEDGIEGAVGS